MSDIKSVMTIGQSEDWVDGTTYFLFDDSSETTFYSDEVEEYQTFINANFWTVLSEDFDALYSAGHVP